MNYKEIGEKFLEKKYQLNMGAGNLAKRYKTTREEIYKAKEYARNFKIVRNKLPKILIFDIETAPMKSYIWARWNQNIHTDDQIISEWFMLTWSAKWLFNKTIYSAKLTSKEAKNQDDKRITKELWKLLDEADIVIAHNAERFDIPHINARFLINGLMPVSPFKVIDTLKVVKSQFKFSSNRLDSLAKYFGFEGKLSTGFKLWADAIEGNKDALDEMSLYNDQDVILLEEVYLKLRPWIKGHPNLALYAESNDIGCGVCGSKKLTYMDKYYYTQTGKFETYRCECGAINRRRLNSYDKNKKENLLIPLQT